MKLYADLASDKRRHRSLRAATIAFGAFVALVLIGMQTAYVVTQHSRALEAGGVTTANLARSIAQHAEDTIRTADAVLVGLVERAEIDGTGPVQRDRLHRLFVQQVATLPELRGLSYVDEKGDLTIDNLPPTTINLADRDYFEFHRSHTDRGPHLGEPVLRRALGIWVIPVTRRVEHPDGSFAGVMVATIDMGYFQKFYESFDIGSSGAIFLASTNGVILARRPFDEKNIGRSISNGAIFRDYLPKASSGSFDSSSAIDGIDRVTSYRAADAYPIVAGVSFETAAILANWRTIVWRQAICGSLVLLTLAALGHWLIKQIGRGKRAEATARTSERRYRLLADHSSDMIALVNLADGERLYVSPAVRQLYGYEPEELIGLPFEAIIHPHDLASLRAAVESLERSGRAVVAHRARCKDGRYKWVESSLQRLLNAETGIPEMVAHVRDITERVETQEALLVAIQNADNANRAKSDFLARMSHEIRTPMNGVLGMNHLLLESPLTETQRRQLELANESAQALLSIIDDILDISKLEAGRVELENIPLNVEATVDGVVSMLLPRAEEKGIELRAAIDSGAKGWFTGDPTRLRQILINLTANALKFTAKGSVTIGVTAQSGSADAAQLRFEVADTGIGIADEAQQRLFENFTQADGSITRRFGGTGLGLAICKQLVGLMGGTIAVTSQEGAGSRFSFVISLPRGEAPADIASVPSSEQNPTVARRSLSVLLVEDNSVNQQVARLILTAAGHSVEIVNNGPAAIEALQRTRYDVALMDIHLAGVDGVETTRRIRALPDPASRIPIIACTANAMRGAREQYLAAGMDDYISKPYEPAELRAKVARLGAGTERTTATEMVALTDSSPPPVFNPARLDELKELTDQAAFAAMVRQFHERLEARVAHLRELIERADWAEAAREAHDIGSIAGTVGAARLSALARDLQELCKDDKPVQCRSATSALVAEASGALDALKTYQQAA
jgi:PAS domain S-box-containing protein